MDDTEEELTAALSEALLNRNDDEVDGLDDDLVAYIAGMLSSRVAEDPGSVSDAIEEVLLPFLESVQCPDHLVESAQEKVLNVLGPKAAKSSQTASGNSGGATTTRKLQQGVVNMKLSKDTEIDKEASRHLWGIEDGVKAMANNIIDAHDDKQSARDKRRAKKSDAAAERKLLSSGNDQDADMDSGGGLVRMNVRSFRVGQSTDKTRDVLVRNVTVSLDNGTVLLDSGELKFAYQRRYGLIGENGVGKSTLLKAIAKEGGVEGFPTHLRVLHVRQEVPAHLKDTMSVLDCVLKADLERNMLVDREKEILAKLDAAGDTDASGMSIEEKRKKLTESATTTTADDLDAMQADLKELDAIYARLQMLSADSAEARAAMILSGLQFSLSMQAGPISALSGGWRMRVALAAALFIEPDILMLEAVLWLENYLASYKHTLLVVSHDRGFLNEVTTDIMHFARRSLTYYRGNFDTYVKLRDENIRNNQRLYHAYQDKREHMMEFINKFRASANRAKLVQSRIKAVEKMDLEAPKPVEIDQVWRFSIPNSEPLGPPIIALNDVTFDYTPVDKDGVKKPKNEFLLQDVNFGVDLTSRIAILGANGQGKTTLLNLIMGKLKPLKGTISINGALRIGHFTQHSSDNFNLKISALENLLEMFEEAEDQPMRAFLGKFQIQNTDALKPMMLLSGGQKSRVAFAALAWRKPHVLIIDEGSNHLSMEAVDALVEAVQDFKGGIMVVSHDAYFVSKTCSELWVVHNGVATRFRGDFDEYKAHTAEITEKRVEESVKRVNAINK